MFSSRARLTSWQRCLMFFSMRGFLGRGSIFFFAPSYCLGVPESSVLRAGHLLWTQVWFYISYYIFDVLIEIIYIFLEIAGRETHEAMNVMIFAVQEKG